MFISLSNKLDLCFFPIFEGQQSTSIYLEVLSIILLLLIFITSACNWKTMYFYVKLPNKQTNKTNKQKKCAAQSNE